MTALCWVVLVAVAVSGLFLCLAVFRRRERVWHGRAERGITALVQDGHCIHDRIVEGETIDCPAQGVESCTECWRVVFGLPIDTPVSALYHSAEPKRERS